MNRLSDSLPILIERFGSQWLRRTADMLLAIPFGVTGLVTGFYIVSWQTDPLVHFTHMLFVLGFWMIGTIALFIFMIPVCLKLKVPFRAVTFPAVAIALAIYFTPLSRFRTMFPGQAGLIFPASVGMLSLAIACFVVLRFRNKVIETQIH